MPISRIATPLFVVVVLTGCSASQANSPMDGGNLAMTGQFDAATNDQSRATDLAVTADLSSTPDLAAPPDLARPADLAEAVDLANPRDLSAPADLSTAPDLVSGADIAVAPDLKPPGGCAFDTDCAIDSSYCLTRPCACIPRRTSDPAFVCGGQVVNCFVDPCQGKRAACDVATGTCTVQ